MSAQERAAGGGKALFMGLLASLLLNFGLGLSLVWVNTERTALGYELRVLQQTLSERAAYSSKLEMERDRLLSPYHLERQARDLGMKGARPGQIRRLEEPGRTETR